MTYVSAPGRIFVSETSALFTDSRLDLLHRRILRGALGPDPVAHPTINNRAHRIHRQNVVREAKGNCAYFVQALELFQGDLHVEASDVVLYLSKFACTDDWNHRYRTVEQPREGNLRRRDVKFL